MTRDPLGHMTDDEFVRFVLDDLPPGEAETLDAHLQECAPCTSTLESYYAADDTFPVAEWAARRSASQERLRERLREAMNRSEAVTPPLDALDMSVWARLRELFGTAATSIFVPSPLAAGEALFATKSPTGGIRTDHVYQFEDWLRWTLPREDGEQVIYLEATRGSRVLVVVYGETGREKSQGVELTTLDVEGTPFMWGARVVLGAVTSLRGDFTDYRVAVLPQED